MESRLGDLELDLVDCEGTYLTSSDLSRRGRPIILIVIIAPADVSISCRLFPVPNQNRRLIRQQYSLDSRPG